MKSLLKVTFLLISSILISCGGNTNSKEETAESSQEEQQSLKGMQEIDLNDYQLNASIFIPDESKGKTEITETSWGSIEILVGSGFGIEIVPFGMTVADKKTELASDLVYNVEYVVENENTILYKKTIKESDIEPEFHFFITNNLNGDLVEVKNLSDNTYSKSQIERMIESANSLSAKHPI